METDGLFSLTPPGDASALTAPSAYTAPSAFTAPSADSPLPVRMRPASLDELVGQKHLLAPGAPLRQLVTGTSPMSVILWGPPGTGKTTIAHLVASATDRKFVAMSALSAGVKDVRAVIDTARRERRHGGPPTVLFIDEVHRFSKTQQDSLLAAVEDRTVTLLAATTENPYFSVISPLLSRCVLLTLHQLTDDDVRLLVRRALTDPRGLAGAVTLATEAEDHLVRLASGDVRKALTALEAAASSAQAQGATEIDLATAEKAVDIAAVRYDRDGDAHYDVISAFIKSMRGSDPDAALHWLARMLVAGEDPRFIARRIVIFASEDVGMADPQALLVATAAAQAVQNVGLPEAQLNLAQAVVHLATAPKSNSVTTALGAAMADVRAGRGGPVPPHLRDAHYPGSKGLGHGRGYRYPHDDARGVVTQQYVPDDLVGADYYQPGPHGAERAVQERVPRLRRVVRGLSRPVEPAGPGPSPSVVDAPVERESPATTPPLPGSAVASLSPSTAASVEPGGREDPLPSPTDATEGEEADALRDGGGVSAGGVDRAAGGAAGADASQSSADIVDDGEPARTTGGKKKASSGRGRRKPAAVPAKENPADDGGETAGEERS
ncbi:replication-associated recombination protein A [Actinoplanes sp. TBRC 11911]|uniref:replication-associated recombination protein A n=1 Tax=Actinoplanes sp. TBRC 11911 TaxID=2729386 RepID=UPI00145DD013|nr:replication-associated recombination protein A [Actinoplanes sp. TBRC 11911]NMO56291.1 replication-associated recombination protein A [Actinoplanes sp. TBRC 11911]